MPVANLTVRVQGPDAAVARWGLVNARLLPFHGQATAIVSIADVSEHKHTETQLRVLAERDALTGVLMRRPFIELAGGELARCERDGRSLCLAMLDLDDFKAVNDRYGHEAGDAVLRAVAASVRASVRTDDLVARFGGDEFLILLRDSGRDQGSLVMERTRADLGLFRDADPSGPLHVDRQRRSRRVARRREPRVPDGARRRGALPLRSSAAATGSCARNRPGSRRPPCHGRSQCRGRGLQGPENMP